MTRLAELSGPEYPPHVQVKAVAKIATELSPNTPTTPTLWSRLGRRICTSPV